MMHRHLPPAELVRQAGEIARRLADTARLHNEPHVAERFEQIAAESEERARHLDDLARISSAPGGLVEIALIDEHEAAVRALDDRQSG